MSRDSFDEDPHDRTRRLGVSQGASDDLAPLRRFRVALEIDAATASTDNGKVAILTIANLAARLGPYLPNIYLVIPETSPLSSRVYPTADTLAAQTLWIAHNATSEEGFRRLLAIDEGEPYDVVVTIGCSSVRTRTQVFVGWNEHLGQVGDAVLSTHGTSVFGPLLASALAVARLHAILLRQIGATSIPPPPGTVSVDAFSLGSELEIGPTLDHAVLPRTLLVGAGALGSSFVYALSHISTLTGTIDVVDHDHLKRANANRQITAPYSAAITGEAKVDDLARACGLVRPYAERYEDFKTRTGESAGNYEIAVTALDNAEVRRAVATDLPRVVLDGATGGLLLSMARASDPLESCLACEYVPILTDTIGEWSRRLGLPRSTIEQLSVGKLQFSTEVISQIQQAGRIDIDSYDPDLLRSEGWAYITRPRCGTASPDRDLPTASVSYLSALCGFLMAAQYLAEVTGAPTLTSELSRWTWDDVLRNSSGQRTRAARAASCVARHELRSDIYGRRWKR